MSLHSAVTVPANTVTVLACLGQFPCLEVLPYCGAFGSTAVPVRWGARGYAVHVAQSDGNWTRDAGRGAGCSFQMNCSAGSRITVTGCWCASTENFQIDSVMASSESILTIAPMQALVVGF